MFTRVSYFRVIPAFLLAGAAAPVHGQSAQRPAAPGTQAPAQAAAPAAPQPAVQTDGAGAFTLTVKSRMVTVTSTVRDKNGALLRDLTQEEFTVREDGKKQTIRSFDIDNALPLTIGLLVDTSHSQDRYAGEVRVASRTFLHHMLTRPEDRAFLERFDCKAMLLQKLTPDLNALDRGLGHLVNPPGTNQPIGTVLWDAIIATSDQIVSKERGRRALIIMTDGEDVGSRSKLDDAIHVAQLYDVPVYSILYTDKDPGYMGYMDPQLRAMNKVAIGPRSMEILSQATGGRTFHVTPTSPIDGIFAAIEDDLRTQYLLGFVPAKSAPGSQHMLEVKVSRPHTVVQARNAYFTLP